MCGISGVLNTATPIGLNDIELVQKMNQVMKHRGPDDEGLFNDENAVLGHRRLSIIDLSANGHQPFNSEDDRYHLVFNGEIYNYIELREELRSLGWTFRTNTDTEVLLKAFQQFGKECLNKFNGMFAFAIYDVVEKSVFLARDRVGIKPLYYAQIGTKLYFASEMKALRLIPELTRTINQQTLFDYLCFNRTDVYDETFLVEIKRLPKAHFAEFKNNQLHIEEWWNPEFFLTNQNGRTEDTILKNIREILISAVELRMRSDVTVGSCLSGGLDSSIITGIIFDVLKQKENFKTFTVSFPGHSIDETQYVNKLNQKYPFENYRTYPTADDAYSNLKDFIYFHDEPVSSPTFYSQYEVMRLAKSHHVTVLLDGQGGDESFAGYQYFHGFNFTGLYKEKEYLKLFKEVTTAFLRKQEKEAFQTFIFQILSDWAKKRLLLNKINFVQHDFFYKYIDNSLIFQRFFTANDLNMSLVRHFQYKLEHLLRAEDRNSMAFSLEARLPYLDYRLIEYVLSVSAALKIKKGENKILQKRSLGMFSIDDILNRKDKIGFGTPGEEWMKSENWHKLTVESYDFLTHQYPEVFIKKAVLKDNLFDKWKVNQLALWLGDLAN